MPEKNTKLVYSTDRNIPRKEKPAGKSASPTTNSAQLRVIVRLDRKGRGGKSVTVIDGLQIPPKEKEALLKRLKAGLGTGGTVKGASLEIQGDHCDSILAALADMGYRPKRSGG